MDRDDAFETKYLDRKGVERHLSVPNVRRRYCNSCNEEILDDTASRKVEGARRAAMGLLDADEIRELRARFGKTQVQMSHLLGVGEKTYCRWESGLFVQSVAFDNYLRLILEVPEASLLLMRLEKHEATKGPSIPTEDEFEFLVDIGSLNEPAAKFTHQLVTGTLHTSSEYCP